MAAGSEKLDAVLLPAHTPPGAAPWSTGSWLVVLLALAIAVPAAIVFVRRHGLRRPAVFVGGWLLILLGVLMLPSPCPGSPVLMLAGLGLLATEFHWARRPLERLRSLLDRFRRR